jgi:hypothetical protein
MYKLIVRPTGKLAAAALAATVAMCALSPVRAAPTGRIPGVGTAGSAGHPNAASAPAQECTDLHSLSCQSTDPIVAIYIYYHGDTSHCTFVWNVAWGDGDKSKHLVATDPPDGAVLLAQHTFAKAGTYSIVITGTVTAGNCTATGFTFTFKLTNPYECSCVTYVRDNLAAQGIDLPGGPATASGYTEKWMRAHDWSRVKPPNNGAIPDASKPMVIVWDANEKGASGAGHMAIIVDAWSRKHLSASGKSPWYDRATKKWNITVLQDDWSTDPSTCTPARHLFDSWGDLYGVNFYVPKG